MKHPFWVGAGLWLWLLCTPVSLSAQALPQDADLRLLVDVSGSMQATDPNKLREPALELLVRLMPEGVRAGIWAFGGEVEPLVPHRPVDAAWQERARAAITGLESKALFTHIGAALESASYDRTEPDPERDAHIILLTDGMVDVSPDAAVNAREQERVVRKLVPELAAAGYRIHTIGLSEHADSALLQEIALAADGLFIEARSPDQLMESLLGVFQQSIPSNALPIENGRFLVDESVREFTALIMRRRDAPAVRLVNPAGEGYGKDTVKSGLNWHHTADYDLITRSDPEPGYWFLQADSSQSSRVSVISNMQLQVEPLATNPLVGQEQTLEFWLQNEQGTIADRDLLSLLTIQIRLDGPGESFPKELRWAGDQPPSDGHYQMTLPSLIQPGDYRLILELDGKTFQRRFSHRMRLGSLFSVELEQHKVEGDIHYRVQVDAQQPLDNQSTSLVAHLQDSSGFSRVQPLTQTGDRRWTVDLAPERKARYRVSLRARGSTSAGVDFEQQLPSLYFTHPPEGMEVSDPLDEALRQSDQALEAERKALEKTQRGDNLPPTESDVVLGAEPEIQSDPQVVPVSEPRRRSVWHSVLLYGGVVFLNFAFLGLAYWGYRKILGLGAKPSAEPSNEEQDDAESSPPPPMQEIEPEPETDSSAEFELELGDEETETSNSEVSDGEQEQDEDLDRLDLSEDEESLFSLEDDQNDDDQPEPKSNQSESDTDDQNSEDESSEDESLEDKGSGDKGSGDSTEPETKPPKE